jgi:hypothetical protein
LPSLINQGCCFGQLFEGDFIDIGIPEDYKRSHLFFTTELGCF